MLEREGLIIYVVTRGLDTIECIKECPDTFILLRFAYEYIFH